MDTPERNINHEGELAAHPIRIFIRERVKCTEVIDHAVAGSAADESVANLVERSTGGGRQGDVIKMSALEHPWSRSCMWISRGFDGVQP